MNTTKPDEHTTAESPRETKKLKEMSFLDHLDELRSVIVQSCVVFFVLLVVSWFFSAQLLEMLLLDLPIESLYFNSPMEAFMARLKVSLVASLMVAFPFILFKIWSFVAPGLFANERKKIYPFVIVSSALFYIGVVFCYIVLIPVVMRMFLSFGTEHMKPLISIGAYFAFVSRMCFTFGLVFQIPIVVMILTSIGLVSPAYLLRQWRYATVIIFVVAAILTPPDAISQLLMAIPVMLLYIGSVVTAYVTVRKKKRTEED
ncbi:MAG: twin-arginine translocase subunit TatC [Chitinivibrionia bacterium]|nr:twin-arginine translocase subunit TatC [Chitinivibrionia bacterium]